MIDPPSSGDGEKVRVIEVAFEAPYYGAGGLAGA